MFEKEAKLRAKDYTENKERQIAYGCGFLDGVDFAYNKANEWHYVKLVSKIGNQEKRIAELEKENAKLKKAVEHYRNERAFFIEELEND